MPSLTRSSLRFLKNMPDMSVESLVLPFVALAAIKNVKNRQDLIPRVAEWADGEGRDVVRGMIELQNEVRSTRSVDRQKTILQNVEAVLSAEFSRGFSVILNLSSFIMGGVIGKIDVEAARNTVRFARNGSYRWLWSIQEPDLRREWRRKIVDLARLPH